MADTVQGKTVDFGMVMQRVRAAMSQLPDIRRGKNVQYSVADAGLSALSVFFMQCPSFLEFQRRMQQTQGHNNAQTLFGVHAIPCDNQIRHLLDAVPPQALEPLYEELLQCLMREGVVEGYRTLNNKVLLALDGVTYFSSTTLHCPQCSQRSHAGRTVYSHTALTPVLVKADQSKVVALAPEFITPQDGQTKQDCELNAAYRWLLRHGPWTSCWCANPTHTPSSASGCRCSNARGMCTRSGCAAVMGSRSIWTATAGHTPCPCVMATMRSAWTGAS